MDFKQPQIKIEYHDELNEILSKVIADLGEDAGTLFVYFVSAFSTAGGRASSAAERMRDLCLENGVVIPFNKMSERFYYPFNGDNPQYLNPYGEFRNPLTNYILEAVLIAHRGLPKDKMPPGDYFEHAIQVVQKEYGRLIR
ncbi:MAG: hypothetical protein ABIM99_00810 [Candidatus Dojkabacteria bacterium]